MDIKRPITVAANKFVLKNFRERFVHEATKKPAKLMKRVCHEIESVFEDRFFNRVPNYPENEKCFLFDLSGHLSILSWKDAMEVVGIGGGGILIIDESGSRFFAQSEGFPPDKHYFGEG